MSSHFSLAYIEQPSSYHYNHFLTYIPNPLSLFFHWTHIANPALGSTQCSACSLNNWMYLDQSQACLLVWLVWLVWPHISRGPSVPPLSKAIIFFLVNPLFSELTFLIFKSVLQHLYTWKTIHILSKSRSLGVKGAVINRFGGQQAKQYCFRQIIFPYLIPFPSPHFHLMISWLISQRL